MTVFLWGYRWFIGLIVTFHCKHFVIWKWFFKFILSNDVIKLVLWHFNTNRHCFTGAAPENGSTGSTTPTTLQPTLMVNSFSDQISQSTDVLSIATATIPSPHTCISPNNSHSSPMGSPLNLGLHHNMQAPTPPMSSTDHLLTASAMVSTIDHLTAHQHNDSPISSPPLSSESYTTKVNGSSYSFKQEVS